MWILTGLMLFCSEGVCDQNWVSKVPSTFSTKEKCLEQAEYYNYPDSETNQYDLYCEYQEEPPTGAE